VSRQILESVVDECGRISVRISDEFTVLTSEEAEAAMAKFNHLQAENAKLRELAKKLVIFAFARCADCDLLDASCTLVPTQKCLLWNECESAVRELGIEVPDAGDA